MNIQIYTHIIINMIVVKLPYVLEKPSNKFIYSEKNHEITYQLIEEKAAPLAWDNIGNLCFGINLYINKNIIKIGIINNIPLIFKILQNSKLQFYY